MIGTGEVRQRRVVPASSPSSLRLSATRPSLLRRRRTPQNSDDPAALSAQLGARRSAAATQDLRLLASGRAAASRAGPAARAVRPSFFAGKVNPVVAETGMQCAIQARLRPRRAACARAELHLNVFDSLAAVNVLDAIDMLAAALQRFESRCLRGLEVNEARCRELAAKARSVTRDQ